MPGRQWWSVCLEWMLLGISIGCFGTYAYETIEARRFQAERAAEFSRAAQAYAPITVRTGSLLGMLDIPRLRLTTAIIEGDDDATLKRAAGHLPDTPLPWERGTSAIAAHRDGIFRPLKNIAVGDEIIFRSSRDVLHYRVAKTAVVEPDDVSVLRSRPTDVLSLITCYPFHYIGDAPQRFVVHAERVQPR